MRMATEAELKAAIDGITLQLQKRIPKAQRAMLFAGRADLRRELKRLYPQPALSRARGEQT